MHENVGVQDMSAFAKAIVSGAGAEAWLDSILANRVPKKIGRIGLCHLLTSRGGVRAEFTVLRTGPERLALDAQGNLWVAGHANLAAWRAMDSEPGAKAGSQVLRVSLLDGNPGPVTQVYGNGGGEIAGAGAVAVNGTHLLIGSTPDKKLLDCTMH